MNLNITLPSWLDMDQPAEAAIAAIILFLAAGYFLRGRSEAPADAPAALPPNDAEAVMAILTRDLSAADRGLITLASA